MSEVELTEAERAFCELVLDSGLTPPEAYARAFYPASISRDVDEYSLSLMKRITERYLDVSGEAYLMTGLAPAMIVAEAIKFAQSAHTTVAATLTGAEVRQLSDGGFDPRGFFVYFLWGSDSARPLYVGKSKNLLTRLGQHMGNPLRAPYVERVTFIKYDSAHEMDDAERVYISGCNPLWNVVGVNATD